MDYSELAEKMLRWEAVKKQLDSLETEIKEAVLGIGKTYVVGNVRATYSAGRKTYDYSGSGASAPTEIIERHTEYVAKIDWKIVCQEAGIEPVFSQSDPSVTLKLD